MNTTLKELNTNENTPSFSYRVVCERCHKLMFFAGEENAKIFSVLCDQCTQ